MSAPVARCDSCGRDDPDLVAVRRVYATPETWEAPAVTRRVDDVEHWCPACRTHYPHELPGR